MGKLTLSGIGCFVLGLSGNIFIEVYPMTGWEISQELARAIVFVCLGFMLIGVTLIMLSFRMTKNTYSEHLTVTNEILRVYEGRLQGLDSVATAEIRQERSIKKQIPNKLLEIDTHLAEVIENQDMTAETLMSIAKNIFRWYDWFIVIFMAITYSKTLLRRIFKNTQINFVIQWTTRFNLVLREYGLGTLPIIESDPKYLQMYREVIRLESGLPFYITAKIHRNILLSVSLNSLRILRSNSPFWDVMEAKKVKPIMKKLLVLIRNSLSMLMIILDNSITGLRGEVSSDIEEYVKG